MTGWSGFAFTFLNPEVMRAYFPALLTGFLVTALLGVAVSVTGIAGGLLLAVVRNVGVTPINWAIVFLVDLFRAIPPLVLIVLLYFGLPSTGIALSGFAATWLALSLVLAAFAEESFWGGIRAVPREQVEAGRALCLHEAAIFLLIVLPQAVRLATPSLTGRVIANVKNTALGSIAGVAELLGASEASMSYSANPSPLVMGAVAYLLLFTPVVILGRRIEARFSRPFGR